MKLSQFLDGCRKHAVKLEVDCATLKAQRDELFKVCEEAIDFISRAHGGEGMSEDERWALLLDARTDLQAAIAAVEKEGK